MSTEVVVLFGADTLGEHGAGQNTWSVLGEVVLLVVRVVVGVDECAALDTVTSFQALVDSVGESIGHVRSVLGGGSDSLAHPVSVGSDELVVEVLDLVSGTGAYGVGVRVVGTSRWAGGDSGGSWHGGRWGDHGGRGGNVTTGEDTGDDRRVGGGDRGNRGGGRLRGLGRLRLGGSTSPGELNLLVSTEADVQAVSREDRLALDRVSTIPERLQISIQ